MQTRRNGGRTFFVKFGLFDRMCGIVVLLTLENFAGYVWLCFESSHGKVQMDQLMRFLYQSHMHKKLLCLFNCMFDLILYVPSTIFQLNRDGSSWVESVLSEDKCALLKDHNTVTPVRLEPAALWSRVKHTTTEPLRSLKQVIISK